MGTGGGGVDPATSAVLTWTAPTANSDGSAAEISGYNIYVGTDNASLNFVTQVGPGVLTYTFTGLTPGTYYFAIKAVDTLGNEGFMSEYGSKTIV